MKRAVLDVLAEEDIQAIPEILFGVGFRSRLEARFAIFFTALGVEWEYERAPVHIAGRPRWPDYWLPTQQVWAEIKPEGVPPDQAMAAACAEETGCSLLWISGSPRWGSYSISLCDFGGVDVVSGLVFALGRRDKERLWITSVDLRHRFALPTSRDGEGDVPRTRCARLTEASRRAMTWQF